MNQDLTQGRITSSLLRFAWPFMVGNLLQQLYNVVDTLIVGRYLGSNALGAVGSSYTLMTFLTSILLGLCMGSGVRFSICCGRRQEALLRRSMVLSFGFIALVSVALNIVVFLALDGIIALLQVPQECRGLMGEYLYVIFFGILATFLYNYFACLLRALGNSTAPLLFLAVSAALNIGLDLLFVLVFSWGVAGAAAATVIAQYTSGIGLMIYTFVRCPQIRIRRADLVYDRRDMVEILQLSTLTSVQQSVMNFGILMVQGRVNSFGAAVMAAFAAAVKIDSFAYMPVQDFGNAFSTFVAQNFGAGKEARIRDGIKSAVIASVAFCLVISLGVFLLAEPLLTLFIDPGEREILAIGVSYLRIEGSFYCLIGLLFLFYGYYRAVKRPGMSVVLTAISLGTRVALAYGLSAIPAIGVTGIWMSVPIGWFLADVVGFLCDRRFRCWHREAPLAGT